MTSTTRTVPTPSSSTSSRPTRTSRPWPAAPTAGPSSRSTSTAPSTGKTIPGGGPSTKALLDPAFRDALGYAVDHQALVDRVLGGYGDVGTTIVPPVLTQWHVEPTDIRKFDIELAKQKLDAAGYKLDANGKRLDKEGKPINLRMFMPDSDANYPKAAQFIADWYGQLGIKVTTQVESSAVLGERILPPEAGDKKYKADYDIELWGWSGAIDPNGLLQVFRCEEIGTSSDSQYCDPSYDQMYADQLKAPTAEARKAILSQMQNKIYDEAVYDILYYDANTEAYRTDRFAGWTKQPESNGTPFFTYSTLDYTKLTDAKAVPTPAPSEAVGERRPRGVRGPVPGGRPAECRAERVAVGLRKRHRIHDPAPRGRGRDRRGGRHRAGVVQPSAERRRGRGRGRMTGWARLRAGRRPRRVAPIPLIDRIR